MDINEAQILERQAKGRMQSKNALTAVKKSLKDKVDEMKNELIWREMQVTNKDVTLNEINSMNAHLKMRLIKEICQHDDKVSKKACQQKSHVEYIKGTISKLQNEAKKTQACFDDTVDEVNETMAKINQKYKNKRHLIY